MMCALSILSLSCLVSGEELKVQVCSFRPNTPAPTVPPKKPPTPPPTLPPFTAPPTTLRPTTTTQPEVKTTIPEVITTTPEVYTTTPEITTTPEPTTVKPTTEAPTTHRDDIITEEETDEPTELPTTEKPTTEKPTTEKPTTEKPTTESPTTEEEVDPTTEILTTTETPTTESITTVDDEDDQTNEDATQEDNEYSGNGALIRVMDNDDDYNEKLVPHRRLLTVEYDQWPQTITDINSLATQAMNALLANYTAQLGGKVSFSNIEILFHNYTESDEDGKVYYELNYNISFASDISDVQKAEWNTLREKITENHETSFYDYFNDRTEEVGPYGVCSKPGYLRSVTPCSYKKSLYLFTTSTPANQLEITPTSILPEIHYTITCSKNVNPKYLSYDDNGNGVVTVDNTLGTTSYSLCSVTCLSDDTNEYREGYTSFTTKVTDDKPTYNSMGSSIPTSIASTKNFTISLKLVYPTNNIDINGVAMTLRFERNEKCSLPNTITNQKPENEFISFKDLSIYCVSDDGKLVKVKYIISGSNIIGFTEIEKIIKVTPTVPVHDQSPETSTGADGGTVIPSRENQDNFDLNYASDYQYYCNNSQAADVNGLCCDRDENEYAYGASCTKMNVSFPFEGASNMETNEWVIFAKSYLDTLRRYVFSGTNFNFDKNEINYKVNGEIKIIVTFYEHYTWDYNTTSEGQGELVRRRSLQSTEINWKQLSSPYVYINTILSYVNPTAVPELPDETTTPPEATGGTSTGTVAKEDDAKTTTLLNTLPEELVSFIQQNTELKDAISKAVESVPVAVAESTAKVVDEINVKRVEEKKEVVTVSFDVNKGVAVEEDIPDDVTSPTHVVVKGTSSATPTFTIPELGSGGENFGEVEKPWVEEYWWIILIICVGCVLLFGIIGTVIFVSVSNSKKPDLKKELEKTNKIMDTIVPIDKIKEENGITDDDIYKPFSYEIIMEGYLLKEGHNRVIDKYQKRYCVLYFDPPMMTIYESMVPSYYGKVYIDEKQSISLQCCNGVEYTEGSSDFTLLLKVRYSTIKSYEAGDKSKKVHFKVEGANSAETAKKWVECFRDFKNQKPKAGDAWTKPLIMDQTRGKITTTTSKAAEKKNEELVHMFNERRQSMHLQTLTPTPHDESNGELTSKTIGKKIERRQSAHEYYVRRQSAHAFNPRAQSAVFNPRTQSAHIQTPLPVIPATFRENNPNPPLAPQEATPAAVPAATNDQNVN